MFMNQLKLNEQLRQLSFRVLWENNTFYDLFLQGHTKFIQGVQNVVYIFEMKVENIDRRSIRIVNQGINFLIYS